MQIMESLLFPMCSSKNVSRTQSSRRIGDVIVEVDGILHCHWPQGWFGLMRPMESSMKHHGSGYFHNGSDALLSHTIVMMSTNSGKLDDLFELGEVLAKGLRCKAAAIV